MGYCPNCGSWYWEGDEYCRKCAESLSAGTNTCPRCGGEGQVPHPSPIGAIQGIMVTCPICHGSGVV